jgi:hypothetical protein
MHTYMYIHTYMYVYATYSCKYLNLMYDAKENDDFKNAKIFKIY